MKRAIAIAVLAVATLPVASVGRALTTVHFVLADPAVGVAGTTTLEIRADLGSPVVGFGLDLVLDPAVFSAVSAPAIGPAWTGVFAPDGDGLAGLGPITGVSGPDVLLASLDVVRVSASGTTIDGAVTPGDLTEGFALLPSGFDAVAFVPTAVAPVPEPATSLLVGLGLVVLGSASARR